MQHVLRILWAALFVSGTAFGGTAERLNLNQGDVVSGVSGITFDGRQFTIPGHDPVPRDAVKSIEFLREKESGETDAAAGGEGLSEEARAALPGAKRMIQAFPGIAGVMLVDDGRFVYRKDGTHVYRYHFAGLVLKEEKKEWAQVGAGFEEGRSRARILYGRAIMPDGTTTVLTPAMIKTSSPSEEMMFFNPNRKVLTGVIPGVEIGCIVEYCYEYEEYNPEDPRLFSPGFFFQSTEPMILSRLTVEMPKDVPLNYATRNFPEPKQADPAIEETGDTRIYTWQLENMPPVVEEPMMPPEPDVVPMVECSVFKDHQEVFALLRSLQQARMKSTPAIEEKVREIVRDVQTDEEKLARIYHWVQENTRYISIKGSLGAGFSGHTAQETFENRYGDCTDKSILFCTMLKIIGIEAYPIIVMTNDAGAAVTEIPTLSGNHCISEVCLAGRCFYLDTTAQTYRYPYFRADDHGIAAVNAIRGDIRTIPVPPPEDNRRVSRLDIALSANGDAEVKTRNDYNGTVEAGIRSFWKNAREDQRRPMMMEYVNAISPGAILRDFTLTPVDDLGVPLAMTIDYALPGHAIRVKDLLYLRMPTLERDFPEAALEKRRYPIQYMTTEERVLEIALAMPAGFHVRWMPPPLDLSSPYLEYHAKYEEQEGRVLLNESFRRLDRIVPPADYPAYRDALRKIAAFGKQEIFLSAKD
ncbi:MAG TPA: DUF3857 domain-containing protein [Candidatus Hydrogenedentes bacterium]|nr:DUF3857 domain-containing protein [Candidatus Hydrogenedentota bacterium]HOV75540.1 DUF3857 domain-containing protein [Candidatus Hydrogenedentota bacterium]HPC18013.1 DUF3857 domain-containing protein [Candidatus Hydrogenedentota bacterium]HRT22203.1 DUF3857 domain-containing protein [Candidatus Hydrogenedentota bacterium]HRT65348.1 DUF3857 domain-containing protein [Candidatus Hydrogenedentota bacterium]